MFTDNPFSDLSASVPAAVMQAYVVVTILLVAAGTVFDMVHKRSAAYFFGNWRAVRAHRRKSVSYISLALLTAFVDVLTSGEFCSTRRRIAHLLGMYGFLLYAVTTVILVFAYARPDVGTPPILAILWHVGALMICLGGYWFWFFIRVDVQAEGHSPLRIVRADLFVLSLLASATLALVWAELQREGSGAANVFLALYLAATTLLFASVPWSKFSHMFYKPAAAFQKRVEEAGHGSTLPRPADKPETFGSARTPPHHY